VPKVIMALQDRPRGGIDPRAFLLALATFAIGTDAFIIAGILPPIAKDMKVSIGMAGLVVSVFSVSYAVGAPVVSALSARLSRRVVMVGGLSAFTVANVLSAISPTLPILLVTRVFAALAAGLVAPACYAIVSGFGSEQDRGKNLAVIAAGFTSATVLGVPLGVFIGRLFDWRGSLGFVALLGFLAAAALLKAGVPEPKGAQAPASLRDQGRAIGNLKTLFVLTPFLVWSAANFGLYTYIAAILGQHLPQALVPVLLLIFGVGGVLGNFLGGVLSDRLGVRWPTIVFVVVLIAALWLVAFATNALLPAGVVMLVWATSMAGLFTLQQQRAIAANPKQSNLMLALNNSALYLGASIGAVVDGAVISNASLAAAAPVSAGMAVLALGLLIVLPQPTTQRGQRASADGGFG
jgi:MFS transporter, DHA1 family, inner membrane transport protein